MNNLFKSAIKTSPHEHDVLLHVSKLRDKTSQLELDVFDIFYIVQKIITTRILRFSKSCNKTSYH